MSEHPREERRKHRTQGREQHDDRDAGETDDALDDGVDEQRASYALAIAGSGRVAGGEPGHEAGQDDVRGPYATAERQARDAEPQRLKQERGGSGEEEDHAQ